jgi:c-di-GMP-related signal transduction protein
MDALIAELDELAPNVTRALVAREGDLGALLRLIEHYELGRPEQIDTEISPLVVRDAYLRAVEWADDTAAALAATDTRARRHDPLRRAS